MNRLAKNFISAALIGSALLVAGLSSASSSGVNHASIENTIDTQAEINLSEDSDHSSKREEFWEKFRQSVTPKEKDPEESPEPKEVRPKEVHPKEVHPKEVKP